MPGDVDVAVVGAGFTALWSAYYLLRAEPGLRVGLVEAEVAGFGASGRNGGWCSALFPSSESRLAKVAGPDAARRMRLAMLATVDEVGRVPAEEGIDAHFRKGGTVVAARTTAQLSRAMAAVHAARQRGIGAEDLDLLSEEAVTARVDATSVLGATHTPHCARIHPAGWGEGSPVRSRPAAA